MFFLINQKSIFTLKTYLLSFLFIGFITTLGITATPGKINYQGKLTENGAPVGDSAPAQKTLTFKLFDAESGETELWSSGPQNVTVSKGLFNYVLGSNIPLNGILWESGNVYLEITVDGTKLSPREQLTNAAYAFLAENVVDGAITTADLANNAVTSSKIVDGAITSADVADNSLTSSDLATNIVSSVDGVVNDGGNIDLVEGDNITITPNDTANTITISATGGGSGDITGVTAGNGLTGGGTAGDVTLNIGAGTGITVTADSISATLGTSIDSSEIVDGTIITTDLANNAVNSAKIVDGTVSSADVADNSLTSSDLSTNIVSSVAGVVNDGGNIDLVAGANINITPNDTANTITISATGGGFGSWTNLDSASNALVKDAVYRVGSDGFVTAYITTISRIMYGYTDGSNPPATLRFVVESAHAAQGNPKGSFTMPVRKDDYWRITGSPDSIYWLPIGSGQCVRQ